MNLLLIRFSLVLIAVFAPVFVPKANASCKSISLEDFKSIVVQNNYSRVVGIASWCASCKPHLMVQAKDGERRLFVVAFDEPEAVSSVLEKFKIKDDCVSGDSIVNFLGISYLPWAKDLAEIKIK